MCNRLKGEYHCFLVEDVGGRSALFDKIYVAMLDRVRDVLQRLREGGFDALWITWEKVHFKLYYQFGGNATTESGKSGDFVSFVNLLSFAIVVGVLFFVFLLLFGHEMFCGGVIWRNMFRKGGTRKIFNLTSVREGIVIDILGTLPVPQGNNKR